MTVLNFDARNHPQAVDDEDLASKPAANDATAAPSRFLQEELGAMRVRAAQAIRDSQNAATAVFDGELVTRNAAGVELEAMDWLWPGYFAQSFLNLLVGESGASKSTTMAEVTARVTRGWAMPDMQNPEPESRDVRAPVNKPGRVLWLGSEDPMGLLTVPRLIACGADLSRVDEIQGTLRNGKHGVFSLQDDIEAFKRKYDAAAQAGDPYTLLNIDPITSYLQGKQLRKVDMNDSGQLRTILEPWLRVAEQRPITIIAGTHLAKDTQRSFIHRVLGGSAFVQLARSVVLVANMPDEGQWAKSMMQLKLQLPGTERGAWKYKTALCQVGIDKRNGKPVNGTRPMFSGFDRALGPEELAGGKRGPMPQKGTMFGIRLKALFATLDKDAWMLSSTLKTLAIAEGWCTETFWRDHSAEYLERRNPSGEWECRPRRPNDDA